MAAILKKRRRVAVLMDRFSFYLNVGGGVK